MHSSLLDKLCTGIWKKAEDLQHEKLKSLAEALPYVIQSSLAPSTLGKYRAAWRDWLSWSNKYDIHPCPAEPFMVALYASDICQTKSSQGALSAAWNGIRWGHTTAGLASPTEDPFVKAAFEGAKRLSSRAPSRQKDPLEAEHIKELVKLYGASSNFLELRFLVICLLSFAGFFRISEVLAIQVKNLTFRDSFLIVFLPQSKTDQNRDGHNVYIARTGTESCPVAVLDKYLRVTSLGDSPENYLITRMSKTRYGHKAIGNKPLSYTRVRETFLEFLKPVSIKNPDLDFGLHSLRSGGSSEAANNDVDVELIDKHARWKNGKSRQRYIKYNPNKRLCITKSLGL